MNPSLLLGALLAGCATTTQTTTTSTTFSTASMLASTRTNCILQPQNCPGTGGRILMPVVGGGPEDDEFYPPPWLRDVFTGHTGRGGWIRGAVMPLGLSESQSCLVPIDRLTEALPVESLHHDAPWTICDRGQGEALGHRGVALDLDGEVALLVGAPGAEGDMGAAWLFAGIEEGVDHDPGDAIAGITGMAEGGFFGQGIAALADTRVAVSAPGIETLYLFDLEGGESGTAEELATRLVRGDGSDSRLGHRLLAEDLDGDGLKDIIASAPGLSTVYLLSGESSAESILDADGALVGREGSALGTSLVLLPTGDGAWDIAAGAPDAAGGNGAVYRVPGARSLAGGTREIGGIASTVEGEEGMALGTSLDANLLGELLVGAPGYYDQQGAIFLFEELSGTLSPWDAAGWLAGETAGDRFGLSVSTSVDWDGDQICDPGALSARGDESWWSFSLSTDIERSR